jgi:hypothetical protein
MKYTLLHYIDLVADFIFKNETKNKNNMKIWSFMFIAITMYKLINDKRMFDTLKSFLNKKTTIINIIIISAFYFLIYRFQKNNNNENAKNARDSAKKAIVAMFIALFAKLDMVLAPFWFIWLLSFYMGNV